MSPLSNTHEASVWAVQVSFYNQQGYRVNQNRTGFQYTMKYKRRHRWLNWADIYLSPTCLLLLFTAKQVNMAQNNNVSSSAWPWNYACLMLTLETQLNSSPLNQSRTAWTTVHFDWVSGNHNPLSWAIWQPPAVRHLTRDSLQSFCFYYGFHVLGDHKRSHNLSHSEMRCVKLLLFFFLDKAQPPLPLHYLVNWQGGYLYVHW